MNNLNKRCLNYDKLTEYKETNDQNTQWIWYKPQPVEICGDLPTTPHNSQVTWYLIIQ